MSKVPFEIGDSLQRKTGSRGLRYAGEVPGRPGYVYCEYWDVPRDGGRADELYREEILASELEPYGTGHIIGIRTR